MGNMPATVIGVADEKQSMFGSSKILRVWLPYTTMAGRVMGQSWLNSITVRVHEGYDSETAEKQLLRLLELRHGKKDVFTWNMDSVLKTAERTTHTLQLFLTLVAVIAPWSADWRNEYYAGVGDRTNPGDRHPHGGWRPGQRCAAAVSH